MNDTDTTLADRRPSAGDGERLISFTGNWPARTSGMRLHLPRPMTGGQALVASCAIEVLLRLMRGLALAGWTCAA